MDSLTWKLPKSRVTKRINTLTLLVIIGTIIYLISIYQGLPEKVPAHFGLGGEVDRWGSKGGILVIPLSLMSSLVLTYAISKMPHYFHEGKLDEHDKKKYITISKYVSTMNFIIAFTTFYLVWMVKRIAHGQTAFEPWIFLIILVAFIITTIQMIRAIPKKGRKTKKKNEPH